MTTITTGQPKSVADHLRDLGTIEHALAFAAEYHENQARMNAAGHATWTVKYPPIVTELRAAMSAALELRTHFNKAQRIETEMNAVLARLGVDPTAKKPDTVNAHQHYGWDLNKSAGNSGLRKPVF